MIITQTLYQNSLTTPLGQIKLAGLLNKDDSRAFELTRVLGSYALVYLLEGSGLYFDANRRKTRVTAGDLIVLFPDLAHSYGPQRGDQWSELFMVFDGPVFDFWRKTGVLNSEQPVHRLEPVETWLERFRAVLTSDFIVQPETAARALDTCRFLALLTEALASSLSHGEEQTALPWMSRACALLGADLNTTLDPKTVAEELNLSYETFRKRFQETLGVAPAHYRIQKRIAAACSLLEHTQLTNKEISETLGFSDPFHFARRFKLTLGLTPKQYRRQKTHTPEETRSLAGGSDAAD
jgi:AraC-like DNA-binding protein